MDITNFNGITPFLMEEAGGEGGGGGGSVAVLDSPGTDLTTTEGTEGSEGEETALTVTEGTDGNQTRKANPGLELLKSHADPEIKKFANQVHQSIAFRSELRRMFPGQSPIAAIKQLQADMTGLAGRSYNVPDPRDPEHRTGIQQIKDRMAEFEEVDLMFYGGDPRLLDGMTADEDGKAAFAKLAPAMSAKWRQIAPNAWAAATARVMLADLKEGRLTDDKGNEIEDADIPMRVRRLYSVLKSETLTPQDIQIARTEVVAMANYIQRIQDLAKLAPETFTTTTGKTGDTQLQERERRIAERESEQRNREWGGARQAMADQIIGKTFRQLTRGREVSAEDYEDVQALFVRRFDAAIKQREPRADDNRKAYLESDDRDGYLAYEKRLVDTYGVPALKTEVEKMLKRVGPVRNGQRTTTTTATGTTRVTPTPQGFFKLSGKPPMHVINNIGRTRDMVLAKQAVLRAPWEGRKAGDKVTW